MAQTIIGIDISKALLEVYIACDKTSCQFANDPAGHKALIARLASYQVQSIVYEATGPYHRALERALGQAGLALARVNPRQARRFAEATGRLVKTDKVDAVMLAKMGEALDLTATEIAGETLDTLKELQAARLALMKDRTALKTRAQELTLPILKRQSSLRLGQIEKQIKAIDTEIMAQIAQDTDLAKRFNILTSIPGIAKVGAFALLIHMPELGTLQAKQAASLAGLAPVTRASGTWQGQSHIRGGRFKLRQALYMPAMVACRFNPDMKHKYDKLIDAGKPPKVAITAVMRNLVVLANTLLNQNRNWTPKMS